MYIDFRSIYIRKKIINNNKMKSLFQIYWPKILSLFILLIFNFIVNFVGKYLNDFHEQPAISNTRKKMKYIIVEIYRHVIVRYIYN